MKKGRTIIIPRKPRATVAGLATLGALGLAAHTALAGGSSEAAPGAQFSALATGAKPTTLTVTDADSAAAAAAKTSGPIWIDSPATNMVESSTIRRVRSADPRVQVWVAKSTTDGVCVLAWATAIGRGPGAACSAPDKPSDGAQLESSLSPADPAMRVISGVVPDGADSVAVTTADGATANVPVTDNAFVFTTSAGVKSMAFTAAGTDHVIDQGGSK